MKHLSPDGTVKTQAPSLVPNLIRKKKLAKNFLEPSFQGRKQALCRPPPCRPVHLRCPQTCASTASSAFVAEHLQHVWFLQSKVVCGTQPGHGLKRDFPPRLWQGSRQHIQDGLTPSQAAGASRFPSLKRATLAPSWSLHTAFLLHLVCSLPPHSTTAPHQAPRNVSSASPGHLGRCLRSLRGAQRPWYGLCCTHPRPKLHIARAPHSGHLS